MQFYTPTELKTATLCATLWTALDLALGGLDAPLCALACLVLLDFLSGVAAAYLRAELSSRVGARGLARKTGIFLCIMAAYLLDTATGQNIFRGMAIAGFATIEALSLLENADRLGYGDMIPVCLRLHLAQIAREKNTRQEGNDESKKA